MPTTKGVRVPIRSTKLPAGALATSRENRLALRITPTTNGEIPRIVPRFGKIGNTTPPPKPIKKVLAITARMTTDWARTNRRRRSTSRLEVSAMDDHQTTAPRTGGCRSDRRPTNPIRCPEPQ